jgi:integrase
MTTRPRQDRLKDLVTNASTPEPTRALPKVKLAALTPIPERKRLTEAYIKSLPPPQGSAKVYRDVDGTGKHDVNVRGFGIRVTPHGSKTFVLNYKSDKRTAIGAWPTLSLDAARQAAKKLAAQIELGGDPAQEKRVVRGELTIKELCELFTEKHASRKRPATAAMYKQLINAVIEPKLGRKRISTVTREDVQDLHHEISTTYGREGKGAPFQANRALSALRKMYNFALDRKLCTSNPCLRIARNAEPAHDDYLTSDEVQRLLAELDKHKDTETANVLKLMLWTGSRVGETLAARWADIDCSEPKAKDDKKAGYWAKPGATVKQKSKHKAPLNSRARAMLRAMRRAAPDDVMVFGGTSYDMVSEHFKKILRAAGIRKVRLHDLRHTKASAIINTGFNLNEVGALLGHTTAATTFRYSHLLPDRLRDATEC